MGVILEFMFYWGFIRRGFERVFKGPSRFYGIEGRVYVD
jgi:hypothetical protein